MCSSEVYYMSYKKLLFKQEKNVVSKEKYTNILTTGNIRIKSRTKFSFRNSKGYEIFSPSVVFLI